MSYAVIVRTMVGLGLLGEGPDDGSSPDLQNYLASLLQTEPEVVRPSLTKKSVIRRWRPSGTPNISALNLEDRHPHFLSGENSTQSRRVGRLAKAPKMGWRGLFQSHKMNRPMQHYSLSELWALQACEVDPWVSDFIEHPICLKVDCEGRERRVRMSTFAVRGGESWFVLGMREQTAQQGARAKLLCAVGQTLSAAGFGFEVVTELHRCEDPLAGVVLSILRGRGVPAPNRSCVDLAIALSREHTTVGRVEHEAGLTRLEICRLLLECQMFVNLRQPLNDRTVISAHAFDDSIPLWSAR